MSGELLTEAELRRARAAFHAAGYPYDRETRLLMLGGVPHAARERLSTHSAPATQLDLDLQWLKDRTLPDGSCPLVHWLEQAVTITTDLNQQATFVELLATARSRTAVIAHREGRKAVPQYVFLPYPSLKSLFKGRVEALTRLRESLAGTDDGKATAIVGRAVHGLGGVGKTRLAVEYAWEHQEAYSALLFVSAETPEDLHRNLAGLCGPEVLNLPEQEATEEAARLAAVLRWLRENPDWLLILDNVDTPDAALAAEGMLAKLHGGHVLITSRLSQFGPHVETLELDVLSIDNAAQFLLQRTNSHREKTETDAQDALALAKELGGLALALEQAGAYINVEGLSLAAYLREWQAHTTEVQEWHDPQLMQYPCSVAVTWQTTMGRLGPGAIALLRLLVWLAPEPLPLWALDAEDATKIWRDGVDLLAPEKTGSDRLRTSLTELVRYSMLRRDSMSKTIHVHRVVQEIVRTRLTDAEQKTWLTLSLALLCSVTPGDPDDVRTWHQWDPLRPHVAMAVEWGDRQEIFEPTTLLMSRLGVLLMVKALHGESEPLLRRALTIDEERFGVDHPRVVGGLHNLAALLHETNRPVDAEPLIRRALFISEASFGVDHPLVASCLNNLARLLHETNRPADAEPLIRRALSINETSFGAEHPRVAVNLHNLAHVLQATNRLADAEPLRRRALAIDEASFGIAHPAVARDLTNLALLLQAANRLADAEPLLRRALSINEASFGVDHPRVVSCLNNLALLLQETNRLADAEPLLRRKLAIDEAGFGVDHPAVARDLNNLAQLLHATNRQEEAEPLLRRALAIDAASFGAEHPQVATDLNNLAALLQATNRLAEAEPLLRRQVSILMEFTQQTWHVHPHLRAAFGNYAYLLREMGRSEADIEMEIDRLMNGNQ